MRSREASYRGTTDNTLASRRCAIAFLKTRAFAGVGNSALSISSSVSTAIVQVASDLGDPRCEASKTVARQPFQELSFFICERADCQHKRPDEGLRALSSHLPCGVGEDLAAPLPDHKLGQRVHNSSTAKEWHHTVLRLC